MLLLRPHASGEADPSPRCSPGWVLIGLNQSWGAHSHNGQYWCWFGAVTQLWLRCNQISTGGFWEWFLDSLETCGEGWSPFLSGDAANLEYDAWNYAATQCLGGNKPEDKSLEDKGGEAPGCSRMSWGPHINWPQSYTSFRHLFREAIRSSNWVMPN